MSKTETAPRLYVACLAAYNNGLLHGAWIEADQGADHIRAEVAAMLKASPIADAEEWAIHDYEGFAGIELSEWEGFEQVAEKAVFITEHGALGAALAAYYGGDLEETREALEDRHHGAWDSMEEFAEHLTEECGELAKLPTHLVRYIDYAAMAHDMELEGWLSLEADGETHISAPAEARQGRRQPQAGGCPKSHFQAPPRQLHAHPPGAPRGEKAKNDYNQV